jgi:hypothetical protein
MRKDGKALAGTDKICGGSVVERAATEPYEACSCVSEDALLETHVAEDAVPPFGILKATPNEPAVPQICQNKVGMIERAVLKRATHKLGFGKLGVLKNRLCCLNPAEGTPIEDGLEEIAAVDSFTAVVPSREVVPRH